MTEVIESLGTIVVDETTQVHSLVQKRVSQTLRTFYATAFSLVTVLLVIFLISRTFTIKLSKQIEEIAKRVASGASNVEHGSQDVAQLATQLSQGTHDQSAALHRTASTLDQVSATTQKNAETAHKSRAIIRLKPKKPPNVAVRLCPT